MAAWGQTAAAGIELFSKVLMNQGALTAMGAWTRGLAGLRAAQMGEAGTAGITAAEGATGIASTAGGLGSKALGMLGPLAVTAIAGNYAYNAATSKHYGLPQFGESVASEAAMGAGIGTMFGGPVGTLVGGGIGAAAGGITGLIRSGLIGSIFGGSHPHAAPAAGGGTNIRAINITVPGSGNPTKVANAIPKAINAQVAAHTQMAARRAGSN